jgi:hypothetical protein
MALNTFVQYVHSNATVTTSGASTLFQGYSSQEVSLIVNVKAAPTGTSPTLTYTISEVDPGDLTTVIGATESGASITGATTQIITIPVTRTGCLLVTWTVTGTTPSFTQVYATLVDKMTGPAIYDASGNGPVAVKPASTAAAAADPSLVVQQSPNNPKSTTAALTSVAGSVSSVTLLAANTPRQAAVIVNDSTAFLYVKFGSSASTSSYTYRLFPYATLEFPQPVYNGIVTGIWSSATGNARMTEMTP